MELISQLSRFVGGTDSKWFHKHRSLDFDEISKSEIGQVRLLLEVAEEDFDVLLEVFGVIDIRGHACISDNEFFEHIHREPSPLLRLAFRLFDNDRSDCIDFVEFVSILWSVCTLHEGDLPYVLLGVCKSFTDGCDEVKLEELHSVLKALHPTTVDAADALERDLGKVSQRSVACVNPQEFVEWTYTDDGEDAIRPLHLLHTQMRSTCGGLALWQRLEQDRRKHPYFKDATSICRLLDAIRAIREEHCRMRAAATVRADRSKAVNSTRSKAAPKASAAPPSGKASQGIAAAPAIEAAAVPASPLSALFSHGFKLPTMRSGQSTGVNVFGGAPKSTSSTRRSSRSSNSVSPSDTQDGELSVAGGMSADENSWSHRSGSRSSRSSSKSAASASTGTASTPVGGKGSHHRRRSSQDPPQPTGHPPLGRANGKRRTSSTDKSANIPASIKMSGTSVSKLNEPKAEFVNDGMPILKVEPRRMGKNATVTWEDNLRVASLASPPGSARASAARRYSSAPARSGKVAVIPDDRDSFHSVAPMADGPGMRTHGVGIVCGSVFCGVRWWS